MEVLETVQQIEKISVSCSVLKDYAKKLFVINGLREDDAEVVADNLIFANLRGVDTHGIMCLPVYLKRLQLDVASKDKEPSVVWESNTTAVVDGQNGLGP